MLSGSGNLQIWIMKVKHISSKLTGKIKRSALLRRTPLCRREHIDMKDKTYSNTLDQTVRKIGKFFGKNATNGFSTNPTISFLSIKVQK